MTIYDELVARGLIAQVTNEEEIKNLINEGKATFYIGFDCTADSLTAGHFMALTLMKRLQMAGNKPIALIGGGTTMIGDPSGRTDMRKMLTREDIDHNADVNDNLPVLPEGFKLMFAGAVGEAHGFECTMEAARLTKEHKEIKWVIVGDGRRLDWVRSFVAENGLEETVLTLGRFPAKTMPWFFGQADVMLVTLSDDPLFRLYAPAKISSYMAAGKPIVAVLNGEGAEVIRDADCGWTLAAGDAEGFARLAVELSQMDKAILEEKGRNALKYYNAHYVKGKCLDKLDDLMGLK